MAKKSEDTGDKKREAQTFLESLSQKFGGDRVFKCTSMRNGTVSQFLDYPRLPTYILPLDFATAGGLPINEMTMIFGPPNGGKSTLAFMIAKALSKTCMRCMKPVSLCQCEQGPEIKRTFFCRTEGMPPDDFWLTTLDYDADEHMYMALPEWGEDACHMVEAACDDPEIGLIILDSIGGLLPRMESELAYSDAAVGRQAYLLTRFVKRMASKLVTRYLDGHRLVVVFLNQLRANIGGNSRFAPSENVPGGHALKHACRLTLRVNQLAADSKKNEMDTSVNLKDVLRFSASMLGSEAKQQLLTMAGKCEYRVAIRDYDGFQPGTVLDSNDAKTWSRDYGLLIKESNGYKLIDTPLQFRVLSDIDNLFREKHYEGLEGADDMFRFLLIQEMRRQRMAHIRERMNGRIIQRNAQLMDQQSEEAAEAHQDG